MTEPSTPAPFALQLRDLWVRFGREAVLRGLTLDVPAGTGLTLLGPNGAGKTTLLRTLAGELGVARGEGRVFGYDLRDRRSVRGLTHFLTHEPGFYPDLTVRENLQFTLDMTGVTGGIAAALETVGLTRAEHRRARALSAGMKKRAQLARLLLTPAPLVLVDEPFANLDAEGRETALNVLAQVRAGGSTLLLAAREPELAARVAPDTLHVIAGRIAEAV